MNNLDINMNKELIEVVKDIWSKRNLEWIRKTWK